MPAIDDLTWEQLNTALGGTGKIAVTGGNVVITPGTINGEVVDTLDKKGVIEFLSKLMEAAVRAQSTVNQNAPTGERLAAFANPQYGAVANGFVAVTQALSVRVSVNPATQSLIVGPNT